MSFVELQHSMMQHVLFPSSEVKDESKAEDLQLRKVIRYCPPPSTELDTAPIVVFDFETTGLNSGTDRIIEIGAQKLVNFKVIDEFSALVKPDIELTKVARTISGITDEMLKDQPPIEDVLPGFLEFINGSILMAHNAEFDLSFLKASASRLGMDLDLPCFCSVKLTRALLPQLESRTLDALAAHYGLKFEARHRSVGDVKVTVAVVKNVFESEGQEIKRWQDLAPYRVM